MARTDHFRAAHSDILEAAGELSRLLNRAELEKDASRARAMLSKLAGKLIVHLQMEDKSLFPSVERYNDEDLKATIKRFMAEMGGIRVAFDGYSRRWVSADIIRKDAATFIEETRALFSTLSKRIEKENRELYSMIDALA